MQAITVDKRSLDVQAASVIRQRIVAGLLAPGTRLTEMKLAEELALSRGTIRAALHLLVSEGLVQQVPYTGWAVTQLAPRDLWELYTLRASLESLAAGLVAEVVDEERATTLASTFDDLVAACQLCAPPLVAERDFALHQTIVALAENTRLARHYSLVSGPIRMFIASSNARLPTQRDVIAQHAPLVEAIGRGDVAAAEIGMREHITSEGRALMEQFAISGQLSATRGS